MRKPLDVLNAAVLAPIAQRIAIATSNVRYVKYTQGAPPLPPRVVTMMRETTQIVTASCRRVSIPRADSMGIQYTRRTVRIK